MMTILSPFTALGMPRNVFFAATIVKEEAPPVTGGTTMLRGASSGPFGGTNDGRGNSHQGKNGTVV